MPFDPSSSAMDVILGIAALATLVTLIRSWRMFWDEDFTGTDRKLATQVAVFLVPPVVVLFHELGHYFVAKALNVRVTGFRYGLFEGSVSVAGLRSVEEMWLIALAGNVVSAGIGLAMVVLGLAMRKWRRSVRYLLLSGGLLELIFSLVVYPLLSLTARFGDWEIIYSERMGGLSWATGVAHVAALGGLYLWWRRRGRQAMFLLGTGGEEEVAALRKAVEATPGEVAGWLALADFYARRGELPLARAAVEEGLDKAGEAPRLLLGLTRLSMFGGRWNDAVMAARRGLDSPRAVPEELRQPLLANLALALTQMEKPEFALPAFEQLRPPIVDDVRVRYGRGWMRMESGDTAGGRADLAFVVDQLPEGNLLRRWAEARLEGHSLKDWADARVPAYERGTAPPPAPLAGL